MSDLTTLEQKIKEKLAFSQDRRELKQNHLRQRMHEYERRHQRFGEAADRLMETIVRPRMRKLAEQFDNARFPESDAAARHHCTLCFAHTDRFPATTKLELGISHDGTFEHLIGDFRLEILPVFIPFQGEDQHRQSIDQIDEERLGTWFDERLIAFVDTYLRLEDTNQYQAENLVLDPICGMRVNRAFAPAQEEYKGKTYYFCSEECNQKFLQDPERYLSGPLPYIE
jgi:YHS domain-containing protein